MVRVQTLFGAALLDLELLELNRMVGGYLIAFPTTLLVATLLDLMAVD